MTVISKLWRRFDIARRTALGECQRLFGLPITTIGSHRQAVEQWKRALRIPVEDRGRVLVTALRNPSWIGVGTYASCVLRQMGYRPTIVYRSSEIRRFFPSRNSYFSFWCGVESIPGLTLFDLDTVCATEAERQTWSACATRNAPAVLAYDLHVEEDDVRSGGADLQRQVAETRDRLIDAAAGTERLLAAGDYQRFILYSGLIGESPAMLAAAQAHGLPTTCVEGWGWRTGHLIYNYDAPALEYDMHRWLTRIQPWDAGKDETVNRYVSFLDGRYAGGSDWLDEFYLVQRAEVSASLPPDLRAFLAGDAKVFLAAPNVVGDSSTINRETIFDSQRKWLKALIEHFAGRPDAKLVIRAHPAEVWVKGKVALKMAEAAKEYARGIDNVYVVDAEAEINTFSLLPFVHAGLVWISSAGVDMVVRGVPVICAARPKYAGLGFVEEPATRDDYFAAIDRWMIESPRPTADQVQTAKQYLYVVFKGFSYEAWSHNTFATGCVLNRMPNQEEHDEFYRALVTYA